MSEENNQPQPMVEVIDISDDESSNESKPPTMDVKKEPEMPVSAHLAELQQTVAKLQQDLKYVAEDAHIAEVRADAEKKLLIIERIEADQQKKKCAHIENSMAVAMTEAQKQRTEAEQLAKSRESELVDQIDAHAKEMEEMKRSSALKDAANAELQQKVQHLQAELLRALSERETDRTRLADLERQLTMYQGLYPQSQSPFQQQQQQQPHTPSTSQRTPHSQATPQQHSQSPIFNQFTPNSPMGAYVEPHNTNILQICHQTGQGWFKYSHACDKMRAKFPPALDNYLKSWPAILNEIHRCVPCDRTFKKYHVLVHFFSRDHAKMVRLCGGNVSNSAFMYWCGKLNEAREMMKAVLAAPQPADDVAVDSQMDVDDENKDNH